ncbi:hypothetical protein [Clostridium sp. ZS2-4]|uniref:hypothetical protein n=1 Tax=Clostridium sp. ZS2-4 TaxID=2987703 RepID=UPI00227AD6DC|nr:hypothetical protein [Clostridium sp. ZS2-4]MCY6354354.1 hypothetical protein [Clostridium sp. ZS2-4]
MYNEKDLDLRLLRKDKTLGSGFFATVWDENAELIKAFEKINSKPVLTIKNKADLLFYHDFCAKTEYIKAKFLESFYAVNEIMPYDDDTVDSVLEPVIPKCEFDPENEIFHMKLDFVPFLHFSSIKEFIKVKHAILRLTLEGIKRLKVKPNYGKNAVLIIFTLYSPYVFDVDNVDFKYIIDAFRYSKFFYDDSYKYVSYMVEGRENKMHPLIEVKIIRKDRISGLK